ncbi:MAG: Hpt domain-containing protein [Desulfobacteraceae bacterium]|nr:Hpt domain-containing protein [Desulfobacteraceae bacterium]
MEKKIFPIDIEKELKEFAGDVEFFKELLDDFFYQAGKRIATMEKAGLEKDFQIIKTEAHAIKGGAANLGANTLSKAAYDLEEVFKIEAFDKSLEGVGKIKKEFFRLKEYVRNHESLK